MQIDTGAVWRVQASSAGSAVKLFAFNNGTTLTAGVLNNGALPASFCSRPAI